MKNFYLVVITLFFFATGCTFQTASLRRNKEHPLTEIRMTPPHGEINSWAYQLQCPRVANLAESPYDLLVIDYSKDGSDTNRLFARDIEILHTCKKTVLCYLSIGEAEAYRFYWHKDWKDTPPRFLGPENPDWAGNYKVEYWQEEWWEKGLQPYLDRILEAGFDGVYLDIVDGYWFWHEQGMDVQATANDMVQLIKRIADYTRSKAGKNFIICPQNGMSVFKDCSKKYATVYLNTINMVGLESLLYNTHTNDDRNYRLQLAQELARAGKIILDVEYIKPSQYAAYLKKIKALDFKILPYASTPDRKLDGLTECWKFRD